MRTPRSFSLAGFGKLALKRVGSVVLLTRLAHEIEVPAYRSTAVAVAFLSLRSRGLPAVVVR